MKTIAKKIIQFYLKIFTKIVLARNNPLIIAITGSTNKHNIKIAIQNVLKDKFTIRVSPKNYNAEIGVPLSILGLEIGEGKLINWINILFKAKMIAFFSKLPQILILELGIDKPKDMDYLLNLITPKIAVITDITSQYVASFDSLDNIALEYGKIIKELPNNGITILNYDDERVSNLKNLTKTKIITYGTSNEADYQAKNINQVSNGQEFDLKNKKIKIQQFGINHIYAYLVSEIIKDNKNELEKI